MMNLFGEHEELTASLDADNDNYVDYSRLGRYAEFITCADLTKNGYYAQHIDAAGFDVLLVAGHRTYRVQVKSSCVITSGTAIWRCRIAKGSERGALMRRRVVDRRDADILALYHHTLDVIAYYPVQDGISHIRLPVSQLRSIPSITSLESAMRIADATRPSDDAIFVDVHAS